MDGEKSVVIYRSKTEQRNDQFIQEHPEFVLGLFSIGVGILILFGLVRFIKFMVENYRDIKKKVGI